MTAAEEWLPKLVIGLARGGRCLPQRSSPELDLSQVSGRAERPQAEDRGELKGRYGMCSLGKHGEVFGAVLSQTI